MRTWRDAAIPIAAIIAILMLVIPMPAGLLDAFLILNMAFAIGLLILALSINHPLELSSFPTILLLATLFRLALEVTATRLILTQANAGAVIATFGHLVVGGSLVVGFIIFLIIIVIQFLVITKGAERVSEVSARFTLDALPGKQMAIDQDLHAGRLTEEEAKIKRERVAQEADLYGAMDGASKFVRGDAIAGLVIVVINLIGGLTIGLLMHHMSIGTAANTYSILTIGEGITTQIPALLLSTATGFLVTRSHDQNSSTTKLVTKQLLAIPRIFYGVALVLFLLAILGIPPLMPLVFGGMSLALGWSLERRQKNDDQQQKQTTAQAAQKAAQGPAGALNYIGVDRLELLVGEGLVPLVGGNTGNQLRDRITALRQKFAVDRGLLLPPIRVRDDLDLPVYAYHIRIRGGNVATGTVKPDKLLAIGGDLSGIVSEPTQDPIFGLPAAWINPDTRSRAEVAGATVIDAPTILVTHLSEVIRIHAWELLSRETTKNLVEHVRLSHPTIVAELLPDTVPLGEIQNVLQALLQENVSVRDLPTILEAVADQARRNRTLDELIRAARQSLTRTLVEPYVHDNILRVLTLQPSQEQHLIQAIQKTDQGDFLALSQEESQLLIQTAAAWVKQWPQAVWYVSPWLRLPLVRFLRPHLPTITVLSYAEVPSNITIQTLGQWTGEALAS